MNERRTRRLCWIALAVLLPVALWTEAHEDVIRAWQAHAFNAIDVGPGDAANFAGSNWRLSSMRTAENPKAPTAAEITVTVELDLDTPEAAQALRSCQTYLEDSSGQRWSPLPSKSSETSCSEVSWREGAKANRAVITERFRVPRARAADVSLAIVIPKERPRYLRFQRPAQ